MSFKTIDMELSASNTYGTVGGVQGYFNILTPIDSGDGIFTYDDVYHYLVTERDVTWSIDPSVSTDVSGLTIGIASYGIGVNESQIILYDYDVSERVSGFKLVVFAYDSTKSDFNTSDYQSDSGVAKFTVGNASEVYVQAIDVDKKYYPAFTDNVFRFKTAFNGLHDVKMTHYINGEEKVYSLKLYANDGILEFDVRRNVSVMFKDFQQEFDYVSTQQYSHENSYQVGLLSLDLRVVVKVSSNLNSSNGGPWYLSLGPTTTKSETIDAFSYQSIISDIKFLPQAIQIEEHRDIQDGMLSSGFPRYCNLPYSSTSLLDGVITRSAYDIEDSENGIFDLTFDTTFE